MVMEERKNLRQNQYSTNAIYEWNIKGLTKYQITNLLQEMIMVSTTYRMKQNSFDHAVAQALVVGFTVQLKDWGDHYLGIGDRERVLSAIRKTLEGTIVKDEDGWEIQDVVATLIYAITKHFLGDPSKLKDHAFDILLNLKCKKLHDFCWYKDVFLTKVMTKDNYKQSF